MRREDYLRPLLAARPERAGRDRLEILAALISSPSFDPLYRDDISTIPGGHPVYRWECVVGSRERPRTGGSDPCSIHQRDWASQSEHGVGKAAFVAAAEGLERRTGAEEIACRICVQRPARHNELRLCQRHLARWDLHQRTAGQAADFAQEVSEEQPCFSYGTCAAVGLPESGRVAARLVFLARQPLPPRRPPGRGRLAGQLVAPLRTARRTGPGRL